MYKWGWDQKHKQYGKEQAIKMKAYERMLDQQNEAKIKIPMLQKIAEQIKQVTLGNSALNVA